MYALGVAPHKDTWWSASAQPGNIYPIGYEPEPDLQALIAILSSGPVEPGDGIGYANVTLINMTCRADGLLLKPDRPAFPTDADFVGWVFTPGYNTTVGMSSTTVTTLPNGGAQFTALMNLRVLRDCNRTSAVASAHTRSVQQMYADAGVELGGETAVVSYHYGDALLRAAGVHAVPLPTRVHVGLDDTVPDLSQDVPACGYVYTKVSPCIAGLCLLGEVGKWVPFSKQRVVKLAQNEVGALVTVDGVAGEVVRMEYMAAEGTAMVAECAIGRDGLATLTWYVAQLPKYTCSTSRSAEDEDGKETMVVAE